MLKFRAWVSDFRALSSGPTLHGLIKGRFCVLRLWMLWVWGFLRLATLRVEGLSAFLMLGFQCLGFRFWFSEAYGYSSLNIGAPFRSELPVETHAGALRSHGVNT